LFSKIMEFKFHHDILYGPNGCSHNKTNQKGCQMAKKNSQNRNIFMFYHLKSWQSWQVVLFYSYECQRIQTKNSFDKNFNFDFNLKPLKMNTYFIKRNQFCKRLSKEFI